MRRTAITLLFLLNVLASVWAAGNADWSKHIVPKLYEAEADAVQVVKSDSLSLRPIYQIYRDQLGSALLYANRTHSYGFHYSPWGTRLSDETTQTTYRSGQALPQGCPFYRTYTGHEDLWMFGLLNMNARLYNPYLGRFLSPDPLLNQEGGLLDYNPYVYARNNPYKYIDRDGELWWLVAAAVLGGGFNVMSNIDKVHNAWDFCKFFGVGAAAGAVSSVAGPALAGTLGVGTAGAFAGAVNAALTGAVSNVLQGGMNYAFLGVPYDFNVKDFLLQTAISGVIGGVAGGIQAKQSGANFWTGNKPTLSPSTQIPSDLMGNYEHAPTKIGLGSNQTNPNAVVNQSMADPRMPIGSGNSSVYIGYDKNGVIRYVGRTDRLPKIRFAEHYRKGLELDFNTIKNSLDHQGSRIIEQQLINTYGLGKNGGQLYNKINSISQKKWGKLGIW